LHNEFRFIFADGLGRYLKIECGQAVRDVATARGVDWANARLIEYRVSQGWIDVTAIWKGSAQVDAAHTVRRGAGDPAWDRKHREKVYGVWSKVFGDLDAVLGGDTAGSVAQICADAVEVALLKDDPSFRLDTGEVVVDAQLIGELQERIRKNLAAIVAADCPVLPSNQI